MIWLLVVVSSLASTEYFLRPRFPSLLFRSVRHSYACFSHQGTSQKSIGVIFAGVYISILQAICFGVDIYTYDLVGVFFPVLLLHTSNYYLSSPPRIPFKLFFLSYELLCVRFLGTKIDLCEGCLFDHCYLSAGRVVG